MAELSARDWTGETDPRAAFGAVADALGYRRWKAVQRERRRGPPLGPLGYPGKGVPGIVAPLDTQRRPPELQDEIIILRDAAAPVPLLATVIDQLLGPLASRPRLDRPPARRGPGWQLVLEGWVSPNLEGRAFRHRIALQVNPLPSTPDNA